ncbi:hypothetical protein MBLNU457_1410t1 [Dothideomycetes sp. NU457]
MSQDNMVSSASPEVYFLKPTTHVPNSFLPVLIYRHVLPEPLSEATAIEYLEKNQWSHGGTFKHFPQHHFHTVTHECYAIFKGSTRYLFGKGPLDEDVKGIEVDLYAAASSSYSLTHPHPYPLPHQAVYPLTVAKDSPHWDNNFCKASETETAQKAIDAHAVPIPDYDPVYGLDGPLVQLWRKAAQEQSQ